MVSSIDMASDLLKLRNRDREAGDEDKYYADYYSVDLLKLEDVFAQIAGGTAKLINEENAASVGLAWFLIAYELGRAHESIINDLGED